MIQICSKECLNENVCDIVNCCIYRHPLVNEQNIWLFTIHGKPTDRDCLISFEILQPFKVSDKQIQKYYRTKASIRYRKKYGSVKQVIKTVRSKAVLKPKQVIIRYGKHKLLCVYAGVTNSVIGHKVDIGTKVYYEGRNDLFVFENKLSYYRKTIEQYITLDSGFKYPDKFKYNFSETYTKEEQKNFHYE